MAAERSIYRRSDEKGFSQISRQVYCTINSTIPGYMHPIKMIQKRIGNYMRIVLAIDSFKGNFTSAQAEDLAEIGIRRVYPDAEIAKIPVADGGEGTTEAMVTAMHGEFFTVEVMDPLFRRISARYGIVENGIAVMEMAAASGIELLKETELDPLKTSTYGTGQMVLDALDHGCRQIILGIGGSATNDGGFGFLSAVGVRFYDQEGRLLLPEEAVGGNLERIASADFSRVDPRLKEVSFSIACDVTNPLCGLTGASAVFGPQKGASPAVVERLDKALCHYDALLSQLTGRQISSQPGMGAAGGLGYGIAQLFQVQMRRGVELVLDTLKLEEQVQKCDIVVTGEGRIDSQTAFGKLPAGVAGCAKRYGKPVFALCGYEKRGAGNIYSCGIDEIVSAIYCPGSNDEAIATSREDLPRAAERLFRIIRAVLPQ